MASFTMSLKRALEITGGTVEIGEDGVTRVTGGDLGWQYMTVSPPGDKDILIGKIYDFYMNREIGLETIELFKSRMRNRLSLIMPYYNKLYESTAIEFDPLSTMDIHTVNTGSNAQTVTNDSTGHNETSNSSKSRSVNSDTPQTMLSADADYASGAADVTATGDGTTDTTGHDSSSVDLTVNGDQTVQGYNGPASELLINWRQAIINVDMAIVQDLNELFMSVWDTGDNYSNTPLYWNF